MCCRAIGGRDCKRDRRLSDRCAGAVMVARGVGTAGIGPCRSGPPVDRCMAATTRACCASGNRLIDPGAGRSNRNRRTRHGPRRLRAGHSGPLAVSTLAWPLRLFRHVSPSQVRHSAKAPRERRDEPSRRYGDRAPA